LYAFIPLSIAFL